MPSNRRSSSGGEYVPASPEDRDRQRDLKRRIQASGYPVAGYRDPAALAKRLERGRFLWPSPADGVVAISPGQLGYLLEGIDSVIDFCVAIKSR